MFLPRALSKVVDQVARQTVGKDWSLYAALLDHWQEIVGNEYARVTTPIKVTFPHQPHEPRRCNGTLLIRLPKGLAMEFSFKAEQIRQRINNYFGYEAIARISFDGVYSAPPEVKKEIEPDLAALEKIKSIAQGIENEDLREALETFGEAMLRNVETRTKV